MNRDVCEHFNPVDLPCDKCKPASVQKSTLREAAQQALEALCLPCSRWNGTQSKIVNEAITALRAALAEPVQEHEDWCASVTQLLLCDPPRKAPCNCKKKVADPVQEPVAKVELMLTGGNAGLATRIVEIDDHLREQLRPGQMLYTAPPQRKPLTEEEIINIGKAARAVEGSHILPVTFARAIERAHGIGEKA